MQLKQFDISPKDTILLAVSGGIDSVVMVDLYHHLAQKIVIAHCNFQLRGDDADADEKFVQQLAQQYAIPFHSIRFDTTKHAQLSGNSIQVEARELRYKWFQQLCQEHNYVAIATAHHSNDSIETFCYNFAKGCGIRGLKGIPSRNENIIRPMLHLSRNDIEQYAKHQQLVWKEDQSNQSTKYARNAIRHQVIPVLTSINPNLSQTAVNNFQRLEETTWLFDYAVESFKKQWVTQKQDQQIQINRQKLVEHPAAQTLLYEWIKEYGFNNHQIAQIIDNNSNSGAIYTSEKGWRLLINRASYLLQPPLDGSLVDTISIDGEGEYPFLRKKLIVSPKKSLPQTFATDEHIALLALHPNHFPLQLRRWKAGDYFCPIGMGGKKQKLKAYLTNKKLSVFEKENTFVLTTINGDIIWVVGHRIDERFKLNDKTTSYYKIVEDSTAY